MELAGIPEKLIAWAVTRNTATMQRLAELADQYQERTRQPLTTKIRHRMMARASHETRPAKKKTSQPLPALRARWRDGAVVRAGEAVVDNLLSLVRLAATVIRSTVRTVVDVAAAALEITAIVSVHHGGRFRHLLAEARRYLTLTLHGHPAPYRYRHHGGRHPRPLHPWRPAEPGQADAAREPHLHPGLGTQIAPQSEHTRRPPDPPPCPRRSRAARRPCSAEAQQRLPVRQQEHTLQADSQQLLPPTPGQAPGG
ncbi:hypothetical protein [Streptomyces sp. NBC_00154]|uniref:hypothetical protein n=1 Tax=Streptomyces sp. NBC_00154 TaxID=2975670 RepID=UPI00225B8E36|nr:hypothetical protein [Streptomyces sp. NBC_00154]MCX5315774.1 hypothetical protein [Streptomyces sp. NBC_00154]